MIKGMKDLEEVSIFVFYNGKYIDFNFDDDKKINNKILLKI